MTKDNLIYLFLLRIAFGWLFLYSGLTKILNPNWTALEYIKNAQNMSFIYKWFSSSNNIAWVNLLNEWGQLAIGLSLISGVFVRGASIAGILLMILYYLPLMKVPYVDQHIIYILVFLVLFGFDKAKQAIRKNNFAVMV